MDDRIERRDFLRGVGIIASAAATTALSEQPAVARNASQTKAGSMTFQADEIIDFHGHHIPARFEVTAARTAPAAQRARWEALARTLSDEDLLLQDIREGDIDARVVNIPAQLIADAEGRGPEAELRLGQLRRALAVALERLEPADRLLLAMRFEDQRPAADIARALGFPTQFHVYRRLNKLLDELRAALEARGVDGPGP